MSTYDSQKQLVFYIFASSGLTPCQLIVILLVFNFHYSDPDSDYYC